MTAMTEFLGETEEMLERIGINLLLVEKNSFSSETLNTIYRDIHTIKGSAQLFSCPQMSQIAHAMETCLDPVRDGAVLPSPEFIDALYVGIDILKKLAEGLSKNKVEPLMTKELQNAIPRIADIAAQNISGVSQIICNDLPAPPDEVIAIEKIQTVPEKAAPTLSLIEPTQATSKTSEASTDAIRVQVGLLDNLMNLVGELVLIRNQVVQYTAATSGQDDFNNMAQRLNVVTSELQAEVMKTRMQPIGNILSKFQRIVRDLSRELGKEIELKLEGTETELDKTLVEAVKDPLTHILRNAVDHAIESPAERREAGKSIKGQILVRSFQEGGQVVIEVIDDGRGLSRKRIGHKAVEKELVTAENLEKMSDRDVINFIFLPGFSTAEKISTISGRGVGMDVVRANIEKIGGVVDVSSIEGKGASMRLKIPLTLAIVPALIVKSGQERFAIPQLKLVELVRIENNESSANTIQMLQGQPVCRFRDKLLPLVALDQLLQLRPVKATEMDEVTNIVVLNADVGDFGLLVDSIEDSTDIVVKPLNSFLKNLTIYSGATVLGDGSAVLVLDVLGLASYCNVFSGHVAEQKKNIDNEQNIANDANEYLLIDIGSPGRFAIPLCLVNRLEEFESKHIEQSGAQPVIRYRNSILPLLNLAEKLKLPATPSNIDKVAVVVIDYQDRSFGIQVNAILDVIRIDVEIDAKIKDRSNILGTALHPDGVVVIIDAYGAIESTFGSAFKMKADTTRSSHHVLFVEDNEFFRRHVQSTLANAGYRVTITKNGAEALSLLERSNPNEFAAILSDIEMPKMTGLELAAKVRANARLRHLPMLALTTKSSRQDVDKGLKAGFNKYLAKLDTTQLIVEMDATLSVEKEKKYGT